MSEIIIVIIFLRFDLLIKLQNTHVLHRDFSLYNHQLLEQSFANKWELYDALQHQEFEA